MEGARSPPSGGLMVNEIIITKVQRSIKSVLSLSLPPHGAACNAAKAGSKPGKRRRQYEGKEESCVQIADSKEIVQRIF